MSGRRPIAPAAAVLLALAAVAGGAWSATGAATIDRPEELPAASPAVEPRYSELPNFHRVDDHLYRGGQPAAGGIARLKSLGVRTIINLRYERSLLESEGEEARAAGLAYYSVPMYGLLRPTDAQVARVMALLDDPGHWPVFVHCKRGSDRAGTVVACYRIAHSGWTAKMAIKEAFDYGMLGLEFAKRSFIRAFYAKRLAVGQGTSLARAEPSTPGLPSAPAASAAPSQPPISAQGAAQGSGPIAPR